MAQRSHQKRSYWRLLLPLALVSLYLGGGCDELRDHFERIVTRTFGNPTPRKTYVWSSPYDRATMARWEASYQLAFADSLFVDLPHRERFETDTSLLLSAQSLHLRLPPGRQLQASVTDSSGRLPFGELFRVEERDTQRVAAWDTLSGLLTYAATDPRGESLLLVLQAKPYARSGFDLLLQTQPYLEFPVAGADASSIRSFWGATRDGGRRSHEGNDIFAARGTPLLAVADGRVGRVRNGGLGGKTVWLSDGERRFNYYYAHLDSQLVTAGQRVSRGDTIGLVGNTGNARTTPPHLHFGVYARGAIDPLPFLQPADDAPVPPRERPQGRTQVPARGDHYLRTRPERDGPVIRKLLNEEEVLDLGTTGSFHRISTAGGERGYVNFD